MWKREAGLNAQCAGSVLTYCVCEAIELHEGLEGRRDDGTAASQTLQEKCQMKRIHVWHAPCEIAHAM